MRKSNVVFGLIFSLVFVPLIFLMVYKVGEIDKKEASKKVSQEVSPIPTCTPEVNILWEQRIECFDVDKEMYDFINLRESMLNDYPFINCSTGQQQTKSPELHGGCVTYYEKIDITKPYKTYTIDVKYKKQIVKISYVDVSASVIVSAYDEYDAKRLAEKAIREKEDVSEIVKLHVKK